MRGYLGGGGLYASGDTYSYIGREHVAPRGPLGRFSFCMPVHDGEAHDFDGKAKADNG